MNANIIGHIPNVKKPSGAQFCIITTEGNPSLFYRIQEENYSDGSTGKVLQYYSTSRSGWVGTNEPDPIKFLSNPKFYTV